MTAVDRPGPPEGLEEWESDHEPAREHNDQENCEAVERLLAAGKPITRGQFAIIDANDCPVCKGAGATLNARLGQEIDCPVRHVGVGVEIVERSTEYEVGQGATLRINHCEADLDPKVVDALHQIARTAYAELTKVGR